MTLDFARGRRIRVASRHRARAQGRARADAQPRRHPPRHHDGVRVALAAVPRDLPGADADAARRSRSPANSPKQAANAVGRIPELAGLSGNALIQTFLFHQFSLLLLLVPIVSATALATHAVIGEKQSKALEPLLATPISTIELLAAKTLTPFLFALA